MIEDEPKRAHHDTDSHTMEEKARKAGLKNVYAVERDFMNLGTGHPDSSCEYAMLFNILHAEDTLKILAEAKRILQPGGKVGVIHWIHDASTPRGPSLEIRPRPEQRISRLLEAACTSLSP